MAEKTTIARPYAQALFEVARGKGELAATSKALGIAAIAAADPGFQALIGNPAIDRNRLGALLLDLCGAEAKPEFGNFINLLAANDRLRVLPEIAEQFETLRADEERTIEAEVISAAPLDDGQRNALAASLKQRLGREVSLRCAVDEGLIGGAVIRAGDLVIDGSITGQLSKLALTLSR